MGAIKTDYVRTYETAKEYGHLRGIALDVFGILCASPGLTAGEVFREYVALYPKTTRSRNEIAKRVNDLANWSAIRTNGQTICPESGRKTYRWVPTGVLPNRDNTLKLAVAEAVKKAVPNEVAELTRENQKLEVQIHTAENNLADADYKIKELQDQISTLEVRATIGTKKSVSTETQVAVAQLRRLEASARRVVTFRFFLSKRLVRQAKETISALQVAIAALS